MYPLFETIKIKNNQICNPEFHLERVLHSQRNLWQKNDNLEFEKTLMEIEENFLPKLNPDQIYKLKIQYNSDSCDFNITPYNPKKILFLKPVTAKDIDYSYKYTDRSKINALMKNIENQNTDIIIIKNGFVTDSSFANLVFVKSENSFTPKDCLLPGTKRAKYLKEGRITEKRIKFEEIRNFDYVLLINAMLEIEQNHPIFL